VSGIGARVRRRSGSAVACSGRKTPGSSGFKTKAREGDVAHANPPYPLGARTVAEAEVISRLEALRLLVDDAIAGGPTLSLPGLLLVKGMAMAAFDSMAKAE